VIEEGLDLGAGRGKAVFEVALGTVHG
jgi:hypothetical protein